MVKSFRELTVWQKSIILAEQIYDLCKQLPKSEQFGLVSQMQRAAISIPSNISEGSQRNNRKEFKQFCGVAKGSSAELETQLILTQRIYNIDTMQCLKTLDEVQRMLFQLINKLSIKN